MSTHLEEQDTKHLLELCVSTNVAVEPVELSVPRLQVYSSLGFVTVSLGVVAACVDEIPLCWLTISCTCIWYGPAHNSSGIQYYSTHTHDHVH